MRLLIHQSCLPCNLSESEVWSYPETCKWSSLALTPWCQEDLNKLILPVLLEFFIPVYRNKTSLLWFHICSYENLTTVQTKIKFVFKVQTEVIN